MSKTRLNVFPLQLTCIHYLHKIRSPLLDSLIKLCDFFDRQEFFFILIPIIWLGFGWKWGMRVFYLLVVSYSVNYGLKNLFALPRPFHLDPTLEIIQVKGYGFPSGAAQTAIILSGLLLMYWKSRWKWIIALGYTLILSFSRVYLGVHFPIDILGGWIVGLGLLGMYKFIFPKVERFFERISPLQALLISCFFLIMVLFWSPSKTLTSICAFAIGLEMGVFLCRLVSLRSFTPTTKLEFYVRILVGVVGVLAIYMTAEKKINLEVPLNEILLFTGLGLWISFGALYFCEKWIISCTKES